MSGYHNGLSPHKVDIWAIGCIAYFILAGHSPFKQKNVLLCQKAILKGDVKFDEAVWENVSEIGKSAIQAMLVVQPEARLDAHELLMLPWFKMDASDASETLGRSRAGSTAQSGTKMMECRLELILGAVLEPLFVYICVSGEEASSILDDDDAKENAEERAANEKKDAALFNSYDKDKSGELDFDEMKQLFKELKIDLTDQQVDNTIKLVDVNNDGAIQQEEFHTLMHLARAASKQKENVEKVFAHLDHDQDGVVSLEDFKEIVNDEQVFETLKEIANLTDGEKADETVKQLLGLLDADGDGKVSLDDFAAVCDRIF